MSEPNNLYSEMDHKLVRTAARELPALERTVVYLHFWEELTETEIASALGMKPFEVEKTLKSAYEGLRSMCLSDSRFKPNETNQTAA